MATQPLIAEDLQLVLIDDETDRLRIRAKLDHMVATALLLELIMDGYIDTGVDARGRSAVVVTAKAPPEDPLLRDVREVIAREPLPSGRVLYEVRSGTSDAVLERLIERGWVAREKRIALWIPYTAYRVLNTQYRDETVERVHAALETDEPPAPRTAAVAAVLSAVHALPRLRPTFHWNLEIHRRGVALQRAEWTNTLPASDALASLAKSAFAPSGGAGVVDTGGAAN